jgi:hypothetical protein
MNSQSSQEELNIAKELLNDMILGGNSPKHMRLTILNYSIDLFENNKVVFTPSEIEGFINSLGEIEDDLEYESTITQINSYLIDPDPAFSTKILKSLKLCLMRCLSRTLIRNH